MSAMDGMGPPGSNLGVAGGVEGVEGAEGGKKGGKGKGKATTSSKFKRVAGGKSWEDDTLADWPESEFPS